MKLVLICSVFVLFISVSLCDVNAQPQQTKICTGCYVPDEAVHCSEVVNPLEFPPNCAASKCVMRQYGEFQLPMCPNEKQNFYVDDPYLDRVKNATGQEVGKDCYEVFEKQCLIGHPCDCYGQLAGSDCSVKMDKDVAPWGGGALEDEASPSLDEANCTPQL